MDQNDWTDDAKKRAFENLAREMLRIGGNLAAASVIGADLRLFAAVLQLVSQTGTEYPYQMVGFANTYKPRKRGRKKTTKNPHIPPL